METGRRKAFDIAIVIVIVIISVAIFIERDKIQNLGKASYLGVLLLCFLANATVLLPAPSLLVVASCSLILNPLLVAFFAAIGATLGEAVGYCFGKAAKGLSSSFQTILEKISRIIHNESLLIFVFAVLPLPIFDMIGVYSGGTKVSLYKFLGICFLGKLLKMLLFTQTFKILDWDSQLLK